MSTWPSPRTKRLGTPVTPAIRFTRVLNFEASWFTHLLRPASLLAPLNGSDWIAPAIGGFYIRASSGSVTLPAAGYDYNSDWTPLLAGLSPAGMAASLAALVPLRMERIACDVESLHLGIADLDAFLEGSFVERAFDLETRFGRRCSDQLDDRQSICQRMAAPVLRDVAEHAVLDLVPLCAAETCEERSDDRIVTWKLFER